MSNDPSLTEREYVVEVPWVTENRENQGDWIISARISPEGEPPEDVPAALRLGKRIADNPKHGLFESPVDESGKFKREAGVLQWTLDDVAEAETYFDSRGATDIGVVLYMVRKFAESLVVAVPPKLEDTVLRLVSYALCAGRFTERVDVSVLREFVQEGYRRKVEHPAEMRKKKGERDRRGAALDAMEQAKRAYPERRNEIGFIKKKAAESLRIGVRALNKRLEEKAEKS